MPEGIVIKKFGGFYFVVENDSVYRCTYRGKHRLDNKDVFPGDRVRFSVLDETEELRGVVEEVLPRANLLMRPVVANVSQLICVTAVKSPEPNYFLLDKLLVCAEVLDLDIIICFNKLDIAPVKTQEASERYRQIGYKVIMTSAVTGAGMDELQGLMAGHLSVFSGQSGVGKSSLLNILKPEAQMEVGDISSKLKAGRHTTKHVELFSLENGALVADTPGFSKVDVPTMLRENVGSYFPEILERLGQCKFNTCLHDKEPGCAVSAAADAGEIDAQRYRSYITLLNESIERERSY